MPGTQCLQLQTMVNSAYTLKGEKFSSVVYKSPAGQKTKHSSQGEELHEGCLFPAGRLKAEGPSGNDCLLGAGWQIKATLCPWRFELATRSPRPSGKLGVWGEGWGRTHWPGLQATGRDAQGHCCPAGSRARVDPRAGPPPGSARTTG